MKPTKYEVQYIKFNPSKEGLLFTYYYACENILRQFIHVYFASPDNTFNEIYEGIGKHWVCEDIGGVACIGDYYIDMDQMVTCLEKGISSEAFFRWYNYALDEHMQERSPVNLENFWRQYKSIQNDNQ